MLKKINAELIRANARISREEYKQTDAYWNNNTEFVPDLKLSNEAQPYLNNLFNELIKGKNAYNKEDKLNDLETLVANLLNQSRKPISVSLNVNHYSKGIYNQLTKFTIELIKLLNQKGYIRMKIGYQDTKNPKNSRLTRISGEMKLITHFEKNTHPLVIYKPFQLVILKDEKGKLIEYKDTEKTKRIRKVLTLANEINSNSKIYHGTDKLSVALVAIFRINTNLYGRLHTRGKNYYQGLSEIERSQITIDGEPTIERDFKAMHPNLLYASEGIQYKGDPYSIHQSPIARDFLKNILLRLLNSENKKSAAKTADSWLEDNPEYKQELQEIGITESMPFIELFYRVHKPISKYFCNGKLTGLQIMNMDSTIAIEIINHFSQKGVPILSIHDSFIVQKKYDSELVKIMKETYFKLTKGFQIEVH